MKSIFIAVVIAAACSGVALAGEVKQDQKTTAPAMKAKVMSDSEMDKVTAGGFHVLFGIPNGISGPPSPHAHVCFAPCG
jgi:hypothetical protein